MVDEPGNYFWSSYQINGLGKVSELYTAHPLYLALGKDGLQRQANYCCLFVSHVEGNLLKDIRKVCHSTMALGNDKFKDELENLTGRRLHKRLPVRMSGWRIKTI
jgi:putative transposase